MLVDYRVVESHKDKNATMTINGRAFQFANGTVFLVSTSTGTVFIRQLKRDLSLLGPKLWSGTGRDAFRQMADSDTEIQEFFKNPNGEN